MRTHFRRTTTVVAAGMLTALLATATSASAIDGAGPTTQVTQEINGGTLQGVLSHGWLMKLSYSHELRQSQGHIDLLVDDSTGSDAGWHFTVHAGDFKHDGNGPAIEADNFALTPMGMPPHRTAGQAIDGQGGPHVVMDMNFQAASLDQARTVISANPGYGKGSYKQMLDVELTVPGQTLAGTYTATVTTTAITGPHQYEPV